MLRLLRRRHGWTTHGCVPGQPIRIETEPRIVRIVVMCGVVMRWSFGVDEGMCGDECGRMPKPLRKEARPPLAVGPPCYELSSIPAPRFAPGRHG